MCGSKNAKADHGSGVHVTIGMTKVSGKGGHAICNEGASQRRVVGDMTSIGVRKTSERAGQTERYAQPENTIVKADALVASRDYEAQ